MISTLKTDIKSLRAGLKGQDFVFYLGLFYIILYYLRPQYIYPQLLVIPWLRLTILTGLLMLAGKGSLKFKKEHFWLLVLAVLGWLSAQASAFPAISAKMVSTPFIYFLEVLFFSNSIKGTKQLKILLIIFFLCIFKMSFFGARVWVTRGFGFAAWGIQGPPGYFQNSGEFSLLIGMAGAMSIPVIIGFKPKTKLYWLLPITAAMTVMGASSRGGQLALLIGLIYLLFAYKKIRIRNLLYVVIIGSIGWTMLPDAQKARFMHAGDDPTSTSRLDYWKAGVDMAWKHPFLGIGLDAFPEYYARYYKWKTDNESSFLKSREEVSHNSLVQIASTIGIPAVLIYLGWHFFVYGRRIKSKKNSNDADDFIFHQNVQIALRAGIITYFVGAFFMAVAFYPYIYHLMSLAIINKRTSEREKSKKAVARSDLNKEKLIEKDLDN